MLNRNNQIDILRGFGIIAMILIHVTAWHRSDLLASHLCNLSQFAVQTFIFCSGYLFFLKERSGTTLHSWSYFRKRATRLLSPYLLFLVFYLPLEFIESPWRLSWEYVLKSLTLTGGVDLNWIILLFLMLAVLMPFLLFLLRKHKLFFSIYVLFAALSSILFMNLELRNYKIIMWLPWSFLILFSWLFTKLHGRVPTLYFLVSSLVATIILSFYLSAQNHSLMLFDNKYPPNLYYLLYGVTWISGLWFILSFLDLEKKRWDLVRFFSLHSYSIYFIHFWIFTFMRVVLKTHYYWGYEFATVIFLTAGVQWAMNRFSARLHVK